MAKLERWIIFAKTFGGYPILAADPDTANLLFVDGPFHDMEDICGFNRMEDLAALHFTGLYKWEGCIKSSEEDWELTDGEITPTLSASCAILNNLMEDTKKGIDQWMKDGSQTAEPFSYEKEEGHE